MNLYLLVVGTMLCFVTVFGRNTADISDVGDNADATIEQLENIKKTLDHNSNEHHRRKRWHSNYGYNYPPPPPPGYYSDDRSDYERNQQDLMPQIIKLLDEISSYVKRPPPPSYPQPIYIPYPVATSSPQLPCSCASAQLPNLEKRILGMEDTNQNWGFVDLNELQAAINENRPISFYPVKPITTTKRPPSVVNNGNSQAGESSVTQNPFADEVPSSNNNAPSKCDAAVLSCCGPQSSRSQQRSCFANLGCDQTFRNGSGCTQDSISKILEVFSKAYSVVN